MWTDPRKTRREMLGQCFNGIGSLALTDPLFKGLARCAAGNPLAPKRPTIAPKVKNCIFVYMSGGVSQVDTFEYKPELLKHAGKPMPQLPGVAGEIEAFLKGPTQVMPPTDP